mmetsp:Transcript_35559/g.82110  ORF Transcript_35559/g.82110 Transcript_35559/m.82110 type:complete len:349 (+) Transcript_35559:35-1081(+)
MPRKAQKTHPQVDVVSGYLRLHDLDGLKKFTPTGFNFSQLDAKGIPLILAPFTGQNWTNSEDAGARCCKVLTWMLEMGADPSWVAPPCGTFTTWVNADRVGTEIKVDAGGHSAISFIFALLSAMEGCASPAEWSDAMWHLKRCASVLASPVCQKKRPRIAVDQSVIDLWENVLGMTDSHNVTLETSSGPVTAHGHVLIAASPVLKAMLASAMKEGALKCVDVHDSSKAGVSLFLDMLYTGSTRADINFSTVLVALDLAHRWQVQNVVQIAADVLEEMITPESFAAIAEAAVLKDLQALRMACTNFGAKDASVQSQLEKGELPAPVQKLLGCEDPQAKEAHAKKRRRTF